MKKESWLFSLSCSPSKPTWVNVWIFFIFFFIFSFFFSFFSYFSIFDFMKSESGCDKLRWECFWNFFDFELSFLLFGIFSLFDISFEDSPFFFFFFSISLRSVFWGLCNWSEIFNAHLLSKKLEWSKFFIIFLFKLSKGLYFVSVVCKFSDNLLDVKFCLIWLFFFELSL